MADKPILFSGPMVRAILDGRKTQTRRVLQNQPAADCDITSAEWRFTFGYKTTKADPPWMEATKPWPAKGEEIGREIVIAPRRVPCRPGDRLWVREAWRTLHKFDCLAPRHLADDPSKVTFEADPERRNPLWAFGKLRPGMFMPRWASRLTVTVTEVRVQRLQDISEADAASEGASCHVCGGRFPSEDDCHCFHRNAGRIDFWALWDSINGKRPGGAWSDNPWVVAVTFETHRANIDAMPAREAA